MRLTTREHHPGVGHTSQHSIAGRIEVDFVRARAVEHQLSQLLVLMSAGSVKRQTGWRRGSSVRLILSHLDQQRWYSAPENVHSGHLAAQLGMWTLRPKLIQAVPRPN
jgi:hypothetical protein